ncbi:DNA gyrase inhibitor [Tsukamurella pulmonis]|nr:DNA gyrase inhibitor [Tsukamurella pulmonis]
MAREGVDLAVVIARQGQVPVRWFHEVYPAIGRQQGFRLGVAFAEHAQLTSFGPLSLPLVSAGSVLEVVQLLRFLPLISTALSTEFQHGDSGLTIALAGRTDSPGTDCLAVTYGGLAVLRLVDMLAGAVPSVELHLTCQAPADLIVVGEIGHRILFDARAAFVHIPAAVLYDVCRFSDPVAYRIGIAELRPSTNSAGPIPTRSWSAHSSMLTLRALTALVSRGAGDIGEHTQATPARRGHHPASPAAAVRQERATARLLDPGISVGEIAAELGYSEVASFSHAFTRWVGCSPTQFRRAPSNQRAAPGI